MAMHFRHTRLTLGFALLVSFVLAGPPATNAQFELPGQERNLSTHVDKKTEERIKDTRRRVQALDEAAWKKEMNIVWFEIVFAPDGQSAVIHSDHALGFSGKKFEAAPMEGDTPRYRLDFGKKAKFKFGAPGRPEVHQSVSVHKPAGKHLLVGHLNDADGDHIFLREVGS